MFFSTKPLGTVWSFENKNGLMIRNVRRTYHFRSEVLLQPGCWICDSRILDNYHSLYQQATRQQCISYLSCFYANTWQKQLRGGRFGSWLSLACWGSVAGWISLCHMTTAWWFSPFPIYSICPAHYCELVLPTFRTFHSQLIHSGDASTNTSRDVVWSPRQFSCQGNSEG